MIDRIGNQSDKSASPMAWTGVRLDGMGTKGSLEILQYKPSGGALMLYKEEGKGGGHVQMEFGIKNGVAVD
jgi:hypothetical protein